MILPDDAASSLGLTVITGFSFIVLFAFHVVALLYALYKKYHHKKSLFFKANLLSLLVMASIISIFSFRLLNLQNNAVVIILYITIIAQILILSPYTVCLFFKR